MLVSGFTLIELLVTISIISVLIGILLPALSKGRALCRQVREQASASQLMLGFAAYAHDSKDRVLVGYATKKMVSGPMVVVDNAGERLTGEIAQRYPWRIMPYLSGDFRGLYQDAKVLTEIDTHANYPDASHSADYVVSLFPSLGMNVNWVGGNDLIGEFGKDFYQLYKRPYITRMDEPTRPTQLLTFVSARIQKQDLAPFLERPEGFFRVEGPYLTQSEGLQWDTAYDPMAELPGANSGYVSLRHGNKAVGALFDGHSEMFGWDRLNDMRYWADQATKPDWGLGAKSGN